MHEDCFPVPTNKPAYKLKLSLLSIQKTYYQAHRERLGRWKCIKLLLATDMHGDCFPLGDGWGNWREGEFEKVC